MIERPLVTVGALIVAPDGQILLVRSKKWHDLYSLPGGKIEGGETRTAALCREVWEETHLKITNLRFAFVQECIFSPEFWQKRHFVMNDYIADLDPACAKDQVILNDEAYAFLWIDPQEALQLSLHQECRVLIEWYLKNRQPVQSPLYGIIGIRQHQIQCIVGILPEERQKEQTLFVDLKIKRDFSACLASGQMQDTLNYVLLGQLCTQLAHEKKYLLLETFAQDVLDVCLKQFQAQWAWIRVQKPAAIPEAECAYIELERYK